MLLGMTGGNDFSGSLGAWEMGGEWKRGVLGESGGVASAGRHQGGGDAKRPHRADAGGRCGLKLRLFLPGAA